MEVHDAQLGPSINSEKCLHQNLTKFAELEQCCQSTTRNEAIQIKNVKVLITTIMDSNGWLMMENIKMPFVIRPESRIFIPLSVLQKTFLADYPGPYPKDKLNRGPLNGFYMSRIEVQLMNRFVNYSYTRKLGVHRFSTQDLVVELEDFVDFYEKVRSITIIPVKCVMETTDNKNSQKIQGGWSQVNNTVVPYVLRNNVKMVPLPVIQYAASLLNDLKSPFIKVTEDECRYLNEACSGAGLNIQFWVDTALVELVLIPSLCDTHVVINELPTKDPFTHGQFKFNLPISDKHLASPSENKDYNMKTPVTSHVKQKMITLTNKVAPPIAQYQSDSGNYSKTSTHTAINHYRTSKTIPTIYPDIPQQLQVMRVPPEIHKSIPTSSSSQNALVIPSYTNVSDSLLTENANAGPTECTECVHEQPVLMCNPTVIPPSAPYIVLGQAESCFHKHVSTSPPSINVLVPMQAAQNSPITHPQQSVIVIQLNGSSPQEYMTPNSATEQTQKVPAMYTPTNQPVNMQHEEEYANQGDQSIAAVVSDDNCSVSNFSVQSQLKQTDINLIDVFNIKCDNQGHRYTSNDLNSSTSINPIEFQETIVHSNEIGSHHSKDIGQESTARSHHTHINVSNETQSMFSMKESSTTVHPSIVMSKFSMVTDDSDLVNCVTKGVSVPNEDTG